MPLMIPLDNSRHNKSIYKFVKRRVTGILLIVKVTK